MKRISVCVLLVLVLMVSACSSSSEGKSKESKSTKSPGLKEAPKGIDDFYLPPDPLPSSKPGSVIWSKELVGLPAGVVGWRVLYVTKGISDEPVATSALIYAPKNKTNSDLVAWAHPVTGMADLCAPSKANSPDSRIPYFKSYLDAGYAVVAPDFEGLGTPGVHPFLVGSSEGRSILDSIRMANDFDPIKTSGRTVIVGYSQGGHGALFAGELKDIYAKDVKIDGIVAMAPAGELGTIFEQTSSSSRTFGYAVMGAVAFKAAYPQLDLSKILSEDAIDQLSIIEKKCSQDVLDNFESETDTTLIPQPKGVSPWPEILEENSPGSNSINVPLFIQHGDKDEIVPPEISAKMFESYCAKGGTVQRKTYGFLGASHVGVVFVGQLDTLKFIKDRFAGEPYVSECVIN